MKSALVLLATVAFVGAAQAQTGTATAPAAGTSAPAAAPAAKGADAAPAAKTADAAPAKGAKGGKKHANGKKKPAADKM